jgi:hypothetical protein
MSFLPLLDLNFESSILYDSIYTAYAIPTVENTSLFFFAFFECFNPTTYNISQTDKETWTTKSESKGLCVRQFQP